MSDLPNPRVLLDRARLLGNMRRYEQAEVLVNQCLSIDPKYAEAYSLLSLVYKNTRIIKFCEYSYIRFSCTYRDKYCLFE
jgi:tetratricopeptide (TPR) repeat protein